MKWPRWTRNPASCVSLPGRSRRQSWLRTTLLRPLYFCARGCVQVEISATRRTICWRPLRSEEQHLAVGSDVSLYVAKRAVDRRAEIHRLRPGVDYAPNRSRRMNRGEFYRSDGSERYVVLQVDPTS